MPTDNAVRTGTVHQVHDGDSFWVSLDCGPRGDTCLAEIRLLDVYAAELKSADGPAHRDTLAALLPVGSRVTVRGRILKSTPGTVGVRWATAVGDRPVGEVWTRDGVDVNAAMRAAIGKPQGSGTGK